VEQFPRRNAFRCVMSNFSARLKVLLIFQISFKMFAVFSVLCPILAPTKELTVLCWYNVSLFRGETPKYVLSCLIFNRPLSEGCLLHGLSSAILICLQLTTARDLFPFKPVHFVVLSFRRALALSLCRRALYNFFHQATCCDCLK